jgi:ribonuclease H / adenosylcobalamin/alpha-ribazole phosphatase
VAERMAATRERLLHTYAGRLLVATTHLTPIKLLLASVLGTPLSALFRMEVSPASVTVLAFYPDGGEPVVRLLNGRPAELTL